MKTAKMPKKVKLPHQEGSRKYDQPRTHKKKQTRGIDQARKKAGTLSSSGLRKREPVPKAV